MSEPHEIHNAIALECAQRILRGIPDLEGRLVVLESIVTGVIGAMRLQPEGVHLALDILRDDAGDRLKSWPYGESAP